MTFSTTMFYGEFLLLSDSPIQQKLPSPLGRTGTWYPDSTKSDALKLWLVCGNLKQVSASMNIPYDTLRTWRASKWWNEMAMEVRTEGHLALSHKMQKLADKAMDVTLDRLEHGDSVIDNRTGELRLKPVSMRDAHQVAVSFQDRAIKLTAGPGDQAAQVQIGDRLAAIAEAFAKMVKLPKQHEVIDVPFTEHAESQSPEVRDIPQEADAQAGPEIIDGCYLCGRPVGAEHTVLCANQNPLKGSLVHAIPKKRQEGLQEGSGVGEDETAPPLEGPRPEDSGAEIGGENNGKFTFQPAR